MFGPPPTAPRRSAGSAIPPMAPSAPAAPRRGQPNGWRDNLFLIGSGLLDAAPGSAGGNLAATRQAWQQRDAKAAADARLAELTKLATATITDPREMAVFRANPEEWAKNAAEAYAPKVVAGGSSVYSGGRFSTAPRLEQVDDRFGVATIGPDGKPSVNFSEARGPTFAEQTDRQKANAPLELSPETTLFDPTTNQPLYTAPPKREVVNIPQGGTLVEVPGGPVGGRQPRGIRNNNPGNIEDGPFAKSLPGYKGSDGRFAIFDSPAAGQGAAVALLKSYGGRGLNTVQSIIDRWAPPSENDSGSYAATVAKAVGVNPTQPLNMQDPTTLQRLAGAMFAVENGQAVPMATGGARTIASGLPPDPPSSSTKPMPASLQKAEDEDLDALELASGVNNVLGRFVEQIDRGELNFGPVANLTAQAGLWTGTADEKARNFGSFKAGMEKLRNDTLRLNKGVQTEGDAQRAWNEIFANINDEKYVRQRLTEIAALNERAVALKEQRLQLRRERSRMAPMDDIGAFTPPTRFPSSTPSQADLLGLQVGMPGLAAAPRKSSGGTTVQLPNGQTATVRRK